MSGSEVDEALARVRDMQALVLDHQRFAGFSGGARMIGGGAALAAAIILRHAVPADPRAHLIGWGILLVLGLAVNFSALLYWFWKGRDAVGDAERWALAEMFPALVAGAALTWALIRTGELDLLFGTWMTLFGLAHLVYRRNLPFLVYCGGLAYLAAGVFCLLWPGIHLTDPRPMGLVFGIGEVLGGWALMRERKTEG